MNSVSRIGQVILVALAVFCALTINFSAIRHGMPTGHYVGDFTVFWTAPQISPDAVYDTAAITEAQSALVGGDTGPRPFVNPPSLLPWLEPFSRLPFFVALGLWCALGLVVFIHSSRQLLGWRHLATVMIAPPFVTGLLAGQVALFLTAALTAAVVILPKRPILAGALLGLAATVKPQMVLLAPLALMVGGQWRAFSAALATGGLIGAICVILQGPQLWLDWLGALGPFADIVKRHDLMVRGATPASFVYSMGWSGVGGQVFVWVLAGLGVILAAFAFRNWTDPVDRLAALAAGNLLCLPYAMPYDVIPLLIPAAVWLWGQDQRRWLPGFLMISQLLLPLGVALAGIVMFWRTVRVGFRAEAAR